MSLLRKIYLGINIAISIALIFSLHRLGEVRKEMERYRNNNRVLVSNIDTFRTRNGQLVAKVADLELKKKEFEKMLEEDASTIKSLKKRNEQLDRLVKTSLETNVEVQTIVKDSIIYVSGAIEPIKVIEWSDLPWESFKAEIKDGKVAEVKMTHKDNVDVVIFLDYKRFLWWNIKLKGCNVDVLSHNPYTTNIDVSSIRIYK